MRILHTSDWHVGKAIRGRSRLEEHRQVLDEVVAVARDASADLVLVTGDLFESAAPSPDAQALVWEKLLDLHRTGARVIALAGNHDSAAAFEALRPVMAAAGIVLAGELRAADDGGVVEVETRGGERARVAMLPFLSPRLVVRAADLMAHDAARNAGTYGERMRLLVAALTSGFGGTGSVDLVACHGTIAGGRMGGGERQAQSIFDYYLDASIFPATLHYVAMGHLHAPQKMPGGPPIHYAGSPLPVDFGEEDEGKQVLLVEAEAGKPARVRGVPLTGGRRLRTVRGTVGELRALAGKVGDAWLRVYVREPHRAGLFQEVTELLPDAVQVEIDEAYRAADDAGRRPTSRAGQSPQELFAAFLADRAIDDPRLTETFGRLLQQELDESAAMEREA